MYKLWGWILSEASLIWGIPFFFWGQLFKGTRSWSFTSSLDWFAGSDKDKSLSARWDSSLDNSKDFNGTLKTFKEHVPQWYFFETPVACANSYPLPLKSYKKDEDKKKTKGKHHIFTLILI